MLTYIARRLLIIVPMAIAISFIIYLALDLSPGDAVSRMMSPERTGRSGAPRGTASRARPRPTAARALLDLAHRRAARQFRLHADRRRADRQRARRATAGNAGAVGNRPDPVEHLRFDPGTISALKRFSLTDNVLTVVGMIGVSVPEFFFGLVAIVVFALNLRWFPVGGRLLPSYTNYWDHIPNMILPALVLSIMMTAGVMRYARSSMLDALSREFIKTARSKGLPEWRGESAARLPRGADAGDRAHRVSPADPDRRLGDHRASVPVAGDRQSVRHRGAQQGRCRW